MNRTKPGHRDSWPSARSPTPRPLRCPSEPRLGSTARTHHWSSTCTSDAHGLTSQQPHPIWGKRRSWPVGSSSITVWWRCARWCPLAPALRKSAS
ncbi:hypothetical protein [Ornithinimicrobium kibberense]|uniref:hypothetical protein n=1 Tax=Ornithinimicrobium kibberense TaxID=282060 RepID=UPI00360AEBD0